MTETSSKPEMSTGKAILAMTFVTILFLVLIEVILRLLGMDPRQSLVNPEGPYVRHETRHWALKPNYSRNWAGTQVDINDKGLRDEPLSYAKPENEYRLLVLGGSVTFAYGVPVEDGYVSRLEGLLQQGHDPANLRLRTINSGVGGYSTFQQLAYLKEEGYRFNPDTVVISFGLNDVLERYLIVEKFGGTGVYRGGKMTEIELTESKTTKEKLARFLRNLPKKTAFYSLARNIKVRLVAKKMGEQEIQDQKWMARKLIEGKASEKLQRAWDQTFAELAEYINTTKALGARPVILSFPYRMQVEERLNDRPQQMLAAFAKEQGVLFVDLMPVYAKEEAAAVFLDEDHPTAYGHELAAKTLADTLKKTGWVQKNLAVFEAK